MSNDMNKGVTVVRTADGALRLTIPLTITVRLGGAAGRVSATAPPPTVAPAPTPVGDPGTQPAPQEDPQELQALLVDAEAFHDRAYIPQDDDAARDAYYAEIDPGADPEALFEALHALLADTHKKKLSYAPASHLYPWVDRQPNGGIRSLYTGEEFDVPTLIRESFRAEETLRLRAEALRRQESLSTTERAIQLDALEAQLAFNCEHVVPQSWFGKQSPMRGDLHHLFACETKCNSFRGNTPYFDFTDFEERVMQDCGRNDRDKFEPKKGKAEAARATLYFLLRYPGQVSPHEMPQNRLPTLVQWAQSEPPSDYEKHRNAAVFAVQGNRNPLIDHPEWIDQIAFEKGIF